MPLITVRTSLTTGFSEQLLLQKLSNEISSLTGKPESYVMTILQKGVPMTFGGNNDPSCYIEVKSIGALSPQTMSKSICELIEKETGILSSRIYINFVDIDPACWGYNGRTFG